MKAWLAYSAIFLVIILGLEAAINWIAGDPLLTLKDLIVKPVVAIVGVGFLLLLGRNRHA